MRSARAGLLAVLLPLAASAAEPAASTDTEKASPSFRIGGRTFEFEAVSIGLKADSTREANSRGLDWGPTLSVGAVSSDADERNKFRYELEYSYDDERSKLSSPGFEQSTRVRTSEVKYAKLSLLRIRGYDLKERLHFVPYVGGGVQYVDSRVDSDGERTVDFFWTPTWSAGIAFALNKKTSLAVDYEQNTQGGARRISRLSVELRFAVVGEPEE